LSGVGIAQPLDGFWGQKRHVTVGDDDGAFEIRNWANPAGHGMAGTALFFLHGLHDLTVQLIRNFFYDGRDLLALVAHDGYEVIRVNTRRGVQRVSKQRATANFVQSLLLCGFHARAGARRKDDDGTWGSCFHGQQNSWGLSLISSSGFIL
jgi:hypothetical protein